MRETGLWFSFLAMSLFGFRVLYALYNKFGSVSSKSLGSAVIVYSFNIWNNSTEKAAGPT